MRGDITNITNELSKAYSDKSRSSGVYLSVDELPNVKKIYYLILDYCKANNTRPRHNTYDISNGVLVINGHLIERVAGMINKPGYMRCPVFDNCVDYEEKILARQEAQIW